MIVAPVIAAAAAPVDPTPAELAWFTGRLAEARGRAEGALQLVRVDGRRPLLPVEPRHRGEALRWAHEAVEHLHDALQVDVPGEMVAEVRHAIEELNGAIDVLDPRPRRGIVGPGPAHAPLDRAIDLLLALEHRLATPPAAAG